LSVLGAFAIRNSMFDVIMMLIFGLIGYGLRILNISAAPVILGLILGPIAERGFRRTMTIVGDDNIWLSFLTRPISVVLIIMIVITLVWPVIAKTMKKVAKKRSAVAV